MTTPAPPGLPGYTAEGDVLGQLPERTALVTATRRLAEAVGRCGLDEVAMAAAAEAIDQLAERVEVGRLDQVPRISPEGAVGRSDYSWQLHNPAHPGLVMRIDRESVRATVASPIGALYEGPNGLLHGGVAAMLLDSVLSSLAQHHGMKCVTASMKVDFRRPTPLQSSLEITARLGEQAGRKVTVHGEIRCEGEATVEATALFIRIAD